MCPRTDTLRLCPRTWNQNPWYNTNKEVFYYGHYWHVLQCGTTQNKGTKDIKYCKPNFIRLPEFFAKFAKPSSLRIFIAANQSLDVFGIILFRLFSNTSKSRKLIATKRVFFGQSLNKIVVNNCWFTVLQYVHDSLTRDILQRWADCWGSSRSLHGDIGRGGSTECRRYTGHLYSRL